MRTSARVGLAVAVACATVAIAPAARADAAYRYWTYWHANGASWEFAQSGPAATAVTDGSVEGWRFAVSTAAGSPDLAPRTDAAAAFDAVCGTTPKPDGRARVAIVLDFGDAADAVDGASPPTSTSACAIVPDGSTGAQALSSAFDVRAENGLVCAIAGYPATGCADLVDTSAMAPTQAPAPAPSATTGSPVATIVVIVLAGIVAIVLQRRRRR